jgi:photosystem II stability/assembly factor-like uncharacterized protein
MNRIIVFCAAAILALADPAISQWSLVSSPTSKHLYDIVFPTRLKGWIVGENGALVRTTDGGPTGACCRHLTCTSIRVEALQIVCGDG